MVKKILLKPNMPMPDVLQRRTRRRPGQSSLLLNRKPTTPSTGAKTFAMNHDDIDNKPEAVQKIWTLLRKMDPNSLLLSDEALVFLEGGPESRQMPKFKFSVEEQKDLKSIAIPDCVEVGEDGKSNPNSAVGTLVSVYQLVELAYIRGRADEISKATASILSSDDEEDDGFFDEEEEEEE